MQRGSSTSSPQGSRPLGRRFEGLGAEIWQASQVRTNLGGEITCQMEDSGHGFPTWDVTREGGEEGTTSQFTYIWTPRRGEIQSPSSPCWNLAPPAGKMRASLPPQPGCAEFDWQVSVTSSPTWWQPAPPSLRESST